MMDASRGRADEGPGELDGVERLLRDVAEAVADRTPVDWDAEETLQPRLRSPLDSLRRIERIAEAYARAGRMGSSDAPLFRWKHLLALELLGEGSSGAVYRALDPLLQREVALKLPAVSGSAGAARRYLDEARRLARLRHPNVIAVHGADEHEGRIGIWTELVRGRTLEERLSAEGPLDAREAALVGLDLCRALAAVHAAGLVHGDVKGSNVMRGEGGGTILLDFGAGRDQRPREGAPAELAGTPLTLAPEVVRGERPSPAADLYALGVLLYRLACGRYPLEAGTWEQLHAGHERGAQVPLRDRRADLPEGFVSVVDRALAPDPRRRYASAGEMERALGAVLQAPAPAGGRTAPRRPRRWAPLAAGVLVGAAALLLARMDRAPAPPSAATSAEPARPAVAPAAPSQDPAAPPAAAAALEVSAELRRGGAPGSPPLASGDPVRPGDQLFLEISATAGMHVYVLNEDREGSLFVLFPVGGLDLRNPLPAGVRHRLPGALRGVAQDWRVTSAGGSETILVIASRDPLGPLDAELARLPAASSEAVTDAPVYAQLDPGALDGLRGIAGFVPAGPVPGEAPAGRLAAIAAAYRNRASTDGGIWLREYLLPGLPAR